MIDPIAAEKSKVAQARAALSSVLLLWLWAILHASPSTMPTAVYAIVFDDALDDATLEEIKGAYGDGVYEHSDHLLFISTDDLAGTVKNKTKIGGEEGAHSGIIIQMTKKYMGYTRVTAWEWLAARLGDE